MPEFKVEQKKLTNFNVIEKTDFKGKIYFIIFNNDEETSKNAYFCWQETLKEVWDDLVKNRDLWKEIEIEYEEREKGNKVINIWSDTNETELLI